MEENINSIQIEVSCSRKPHFFFLYLACGKYTKNRTQHTESRMKNQNQTNKLTIVQYLTNSNAFSCRRRCKWKMKNDYKQKRFWKLYMSCTWYSIIIIVVVCLCAARRIFFFFENCNKHKAGTHSFSFITLHLFALLTSNTGNVRCNVFVNSLYSRDFSLCLCGARANVTNNK